MSKIRLACVLLWLLLCGVVETLRASQTIVQPGSPYIVDVWGIPDHLPQSSVISICQAHDGYLWLGTLNGLVRFDGMEFTTFDEGNTPGLNSSRIVFLFEDSKFNLWVGTENAGVAIIQSDGMIHSFDLARGTTSAQLVSACEDTNGVVWLLAQNGVLGRYENGTMNISAPGGKALMMENSGVMWLVTDMGMYAVRSTAPNSAAFVVQQSQTVNQRLDRVLASRTGGYWRIADGRVQKWRGDQREKDFGSCPWGEVPVTSVCEDNDGNLVVGTYGAGVYWLQADRKFVRISGELSHSSVLSVLVDREGNLWVGTNGGGLNRVKRKTFMTLDETGGYVVQSAAEDAQGGLWIGYNGESRVDYVDVHRETNRSYRMIPDPRIAPSCDVKSVFVDRDQQVWAGSWFNGNPTQLSRRLFQFQDGSFQIVANAPTNVNISAIYQDRFGSLWLGTQSGIARRFGNGWRFLTQQNGLAGNEVRAICDDAETNLWIATGTGLSCLQSNRITNFHKTDGLPSDDLSSLYMDHDGALWVGTRGSGLARFLKGKWTRFTTRDGLVGNSISYIIEDGETNLWIGSNAGIMRVAKQSLNEFAAGKAERIVCRAYTESDGLPTRECTQGSQPAACRASDGTLYFPMTRGLVFVHPSKLQKNPYRPPVIIESIIVDGVEQITNRLRTLPLPKVIVPAGKERLDIHFTSLNLGAAESSHFRFRLNGHETGWNEVGNLREAHYSKLPPRDYTFEVAAANEDGVWSSTPTTLLIQVKPPFYQTGWFITVASLVLLGMIIGTVHYLSTQKLQRELALMKQHEQLEHERARIARDLHDQLGANLTQVALLGELAEADRDQPAEVEEHAKQICQTARETTKALDEIVWAVNPSNDTLDGLVNYICKYAQEYYELAGLRYRIDVPAELPKVTLPPDVRHNIFLAAKEAVNNVVKHAQASSAWLRLKLEPTSVSIEIEDDGRGLSGMNEKTGRNGLRNMRKRLEDIGGSFSIEPAREKGALVRLNVPIKQS